MNKYSLNLKLKTKKILYHGTTKRCLENLRIDLIIINISSNIKRIIIAKILNLA